MLECSGLRVTYGQHQALVDIALKISPGEIVVILGANGAGKSSLLQAIAGVVPCGASSRIEMDGKPLTGLPPHEIVEAGVALVPEGRWLFGELTVEENLRLGAYAQRARRTEKEHLDHVLRLFPVLAERKGQIARTMSGGEQQMVAIARAMMSAPSILMLDEPSLGLSPLLCGELFRRLVDIRKSGVGILLVEQNAHQALAIADRGYLLENGLIVGEDTAEGLAGDSAVREAYLGGGGETEPAAQGEADAGREADAEASTPAGAPLPPGVGRIGPAREVITPRADDLITENIADLVRRASEIQSRHVGTARAALSVAPESGPTVTQSDFGGDSLSEALARIEKAAAAARLPAAGVRLK